MPESPRRVILKPPQLDARTAAQLERALSAAVEAQVGLATRSAHILQLTGSLQQDDTSFYIEHEPAKPLVQPAALFDASQTGTDAPTLLRLAAALFDALKTVHGASGALRVHGAICPGVMLVSVDGIEKISDFGFAQAICSVLGPERYLNLAVKVPAESDPSGATAIWEALPAEEYERQDRICAFVDPEKYRTQSMTGFETGSDIIAAGFLLHLLAEREHPYLPEPDAHRMVEMSQFMAMSRYNGSRRPDLRGSSDPGVKLWCELVEQMLATLPQERPTSAAVSQALYAYVKPASAGDLAARQFQTRQDRLRTTPPDQIDWHAERTTIAEFAGNPDLDADTSAAAKKLLVECDARLALSELRAALEAENLGDARTISEKIHAMATLPADVQQQARDADAVIKRNAEALREIARLSQIRGELDADPEAALAQIAALRNGVEALAARGTLFPGAQSKLTALQDAVIRDEAKTKERIQEKARADKERAEAERQQRADDQAAADQWIQLLNTALQAEQWDTIPPLLKKRPTLKFFPPEADRHANEVQKKYDAHIAEVKRQEAIRADHAKAAAWIADARKSIDDSKWDAAEKQLARKPSLTHWPKEVLQEETALTQRISDQRKLERELAEAKAWFDRLRTAVKEKRWSEAGSFLAERSRLARVPDDITAEIPALEKSVKENLQAIELEERRRKEEQRQAEEWLQKAGKLASAEEWDKAIAWLADPPKLRDFPPQIRSDADALLKKVKSSQEAARKQRLEQRRAAVTEAVRAYVAESITPLQGLMAPNAMQLSAVNVSFSDETTLAAGSATISVTLKAGDAPLPKSEWNGTLSFAADAKAVRIADEKKTVREALINHIKNIITARQQQELSRWIKELRVGFLASLKCDSPATDALPHREASCAISLGDEKVHADVSAKLAWRESDLSWQLKNETELINPIVEANARKAGTDMRSALVKGSTELKRYEPLIDVAVSPGAATNLAALQKGAPLQVTVNVRIPGRKEPFALPTMFAISPTFGAAGQLGDFAPIDAALRKLITESQQASWQSITDAILAEAEKAGVKRFAKLASTPPKITGPTDTVTLSIRLLKRPPASLEAVWEPATFAFKRKGDWTAATKTIFAPLAAGEGKRGFAVPAGIAASLAVAGGLSVWALRGPATSPESPDKPATTQTETPLHDDRPTDVAVNEPPVDDKPEVEPPKPPQETTAQVVQPSETLPPQRVTCADFQEPLVQQVRDLIASGSPALDHAMATGDPPPPSGLIEGEQAVITYSVPGLAEPPAPVIVKPDADGKCVLGPAERAPIERAVGQLNQLFSLPTVKSQLDSLLTALSAKEMAPFLPAQAVLDLVPPETWFLENGIWGGMANVRADAVAPDGGILASSAVSEIGVKISAGTDNLHAPAEVTAELTTQLRRAVLSIQGPAARTLVEDIANSLRTAVTGAPCTVIITGGQSQVELLAPVTTLSLLVRCPDQNNFEKPLAAPWDRINTRFIAPDVQGILVELAPKEPEPPITPPEPETPAAPNYDAWLEALNTALPTAGPPWLAILPNARLTAVAPPANGVWNLRVSAPWAAETPDDPTDDTLPLEVRDDQLESAQDVSALTARLFGTALKQAPVYWPIVEFYLDVKAGNKEVLDELSNLLILKATVMWKSADVNTPLQFALDVKPDAPIKPNLSPDGTPASLSIPVEGFWIFTDADIEARLGHVADALTALMSPATANWTVSINNARQISELSWSDDTALKSALEETREKIRWVTMFLRRTTTADQLAAQVGRSLDAPGALSLLKQIWTAKQIQRGKDSDTLESLSGDLWTALRRGDKGPTVFAEYFCGLDDCYSLVWSAVPPPNLGTIDPPKVIRIDSLAALRADSESARAGKMLNAVLDAVPQAVAAGQAFNNCFGLLVAADRALLSISGDDLKSTQLAPRESNLKTGGESVQAVPWLRLSEFDTGQPNALACGKFDLSRSDSLKHQAQLPAGFDALRTDNPDKTWAITQMSNPPAQP